jgi:hypothetical protein
MNGSMSQTAGARRRVPWERFLAPLCCLLLLLPVLNVRLMVPGSSRQETEESRQPTEEERSSEDSIDGRGHRRHVERSAAITLHIGRGMNSCRVQAVFSPIADPAPVEHQLRNGVGGPLRC